MYDNAKNEFQIADNCTITYILALSLEVGVIIFLKNENDFLIENMISRSQMVKIPTVWCPGDDLGMAWADNGWLQRPSGGKLSIFSLGWTSLHHH